MKRLFLMMALFIGMSGAMVNAVQLTIQDRQLVAIENGVETVISPNGTQWSYIWPSVSPDGQHIAYYISGIGCFVANPDGTNPQFIARDLRDAKWLSNDELIGMNDQDDEYLTISSCLMVYNLNGESRQLTSDNEFAMHPKIDAANGRITYTDEHDAVKSLAYQFRLPVEAYQQAETKVIRKARKANTTPGIAGKRIYINAGHGSWGPNDRPMATISHPNLASTGMPDHDGFYESNTNLWKALECGRKLQEAGAIVVQSREDCGPWPYEEVNGEYPSYSWADYQNRPDYEQYNKALSAICEEVELGNFDYFLSIHSNATTEGTTTNFPIFLYSGYDNGDNMRGDSKYRGEVMWPYLFDCMLSGLDPVSTKVYTETNGNIRGDVNFMGSGSWSTRSNGNRYYGYYGVLKHGVPGFLSEGYFHTYQPARHRALNPDYCKQEGIRYFRGIMAYYGETGENVGYIMGTVKDLHEKIAHRLFNYAPKTNDQWLPLNGAVVKLYKAGVEIASYTVDDNYNGIFYFPDLVPGNDYTLEATMEGYKPLFDEYKQPITVEANKTTYPMIYLEAENYEPPVVLYEDYPEPAGLAQYVGVPGVLNFNQLAANDIEIEGTIKRTLQTGDSIIVLSHTEDNEPHLYLVNARTGAIAPISTEGLRTDIARLENKLSDIALTNDGYLVGCNSAACDFNLTDNCIQFYKWDSFAAAPTAWVVLDGTVSTGNYFNSNTGYTMTVKGSSTECSLVTTAITTGTSRAIRYPVVSVENGVKVSQMRANNLYTAVDMGEDLRLYLSPRGEKADYILTGNLAAPVEFNMTSDAAPITEVSAAPAAMAGVQHLSFMRYAGHSVMAAYTAEGAVIYDITAGLNAAKAVEVVGTATTEATYKAAHVSAKANGWNIYAVQDAHVKLYSTVGVAQTVTPHILAYGLNVTKEGENYNFTFTANDNATAAAIEFYNAGEKIGETPISVVKGENTITIAENDLPVEGALLTWAVRLESKPVADFGVIEHKTAASLGLTRVFNAVNTFPETDYFGYIYLMDRKGANVATSGLYVMRPDYTLENTTRYKGDEPYYGSPYRMSIDNEGFVWISDWADPHSGVYVVNPATPDVHNKFFIGTQNATGLWTNAAGVAMGSSTPGLQVYGTGADAKLLVYNEDPGTTLPTNGLCVYNIGQEDGSIRRTWDVAPSATMNFAGQANTNGHVWGCSHGVWVSQHRSMGNNNSGATSLRFYTWAGECTWSSHLAPKDALDDLIIQGSMGSCFAISADESRVILNQDQEFLIFDVEWNEDTPTLIYKGQYKHDLRSVDYSMLQMQWDYAGNLIVTGECGVLVLTTPTDNNVTTVPAKSTLTVSKGEIIPVEVMPTAITLDKEAATLLIGEELDLVATVLPEDVTNANVIWETSNAEIATVDENGHVVAVAEGEATITVKAEADETITATCVVTVERLIVLPTAITLNQAVAELHIGESVTLIATVTPEDADNKAVIWSSSNDLVATVAEGVVIAVAEGGATITATAEADENVHAACEITVIKLNDGLLTIAIDGVYYNNGTIYNPAGVTVMVYNAAGQTVAAGNGNITLNENGIYLVKTANGLLKVRK